LACYSNWLLKELSSDGYVAHTEEDLLHWPRYLYYPHI